MHDDEGKIEFRHRLDEQAMAHEMGILVEATATIPGKQLQIANQVHHQEEDQEEPRKSHHGFSTMR